MVQIKAFVAANRSCTLITIEPSQRRGSLKVAVIVIGETDLIESVEIDLNADEAAMKYDIFKQIITPAGAEAISPTETGRPFSTTSPNKPKASSAKPAKKVVSPKGPVVPEKEEVVTSFAKEALKLNNSEFQNFVAELNTAFEPVQRIIPEKVSDCAILLSSIGSVHMIPLECVNAFSGFTIMYRDFSIMAAMSRKTLSTDHPSFGNVN
jgi:hypothetical protein